MPKKLAHVRSAAVVSFLLILACLTSFCACLSSPSPPVSSGLSLTPIFDGSKAAGCFERIDDVIMGGVSKSSMVASNDGEHMVFSGILRNEGGGFCGFRSRPFLNGPINGSPFEGVYLRVRFISDDQPGRRTFKVTVRDDDTRGEFVHQAMFQVDKGGNDFQLVKVPFDSLLSVRGPVLNARGSPFDKSKIFQVGVVISKFMISESMETIDDFRDGFFSMDVKDIGFYGGDGGSGQPGELASETIAEGDAKRPMPVVILSPIFKLFFNEKSRRRRAAYLKLLERKRTRSSTKFPRLSLTSNSFKSRCKSYGKASATMTYSKRFAADGVKFILGKALKVGVFYPVKAVFKVKKIVTGGDKNSEE